MLYYFFKDVILYPSLLGIRPYSLTFTWDLVLPKTLN